MFKNWLLKLACAYYAFVFGRKWGVKWYGYTLDADVVSWQDYLAVARFETGDLKSSLYQRANNAYGMRVPKKRRWFGNGEDNNYSTYSSVWWSVRDFFEWLDYFGFADFYKKQQGPNAVLTSGVNDLVYFMKSKNYFEADLNQYSDGVNYYVEKYIDEKNPLTSAVLLLLMPSIVWLAWKFYKKKKLPI